MTLPIDIPRRLLTVEQYQKMGEGGILKPNERIELIKGLIIKMRSIGALHISILNQITRELHPIFRKEYVISVQCSIQLDDYSQPEPDIAVYKKKKHRFRNQLAQPKDIAFLMEVANSSLEYDKEVKVPLYAKGGIKFYFVVDVKNEIIEKYSQPKKGKYRKVEVFTLEDTIEILGKKVKVEALIG